MNVIERAPKTADPRAVYERSLDAGRDRKRERERERESAKAADERGEKDHTNGENDVRVHETCAAVGLIGIMNNVR